METAQARELSVSGIIQKPLSLSELGLSINTALESQQDQVAP